MVALILGIIVFSYIIVLIFTHDYKRKNEILSILCVLVSQVSDLELAIKFIA